MKTTFGLIRFTRNVKVEHNKSPKMAYNMCGRVRVKIKCGRKCLGAAAAATATATLTSSSVSEVIRVTENSYNKKMRKSERERETKRNGVLFVSVAILRLLESTKNVAHYYFLYAFDLVSLACV